MTSIKQQRVCREGWTDAHDSLIKLYVASGLKRELTELFEDTKLTSNGDAYPPSLCNYARDRICANVLKQRIRRRGVP